MAGKAGSETNAVSLFNRLQQAPYRFDFYQAMRRLECAYPQEPRLSEGLHAKRDRIRLGQDPTMAFQPSTLCSFRQGKGQLPPRLGVYFFGLFGPNGPLPLHLTEFVHDRLHNDHDPTQVGFLDQFHHRLLTLFYRAWANSQPTVSFDRPEQDKFGNYLGSVFGIGSPHLRNRDAMPDLAKLHYAGRLANQTRNAEGLEAILQDFFQLPVRIDEFIGAWIDLPDNSLCRLGASTDISALGATIILGDRVWQGQQKFRIVMGAVNFADYQRMLPGGESLKRLIAVVKNYIGDEQDWELNLILEEQEVPPLSLNGESRLGWTSWLAQKPLGRDGDDLFLQPCELRGLQS
ncbi:MAG: type VI secretion system baseplate subunit TssG [Candidatus Thiodiazotropha sp. (ex Dulcina madagascariensis)]|nr:type VI secretion system baseplate subunit TssG [Candidatus Thiodiazotropha sp. (ex Dulcina madagascariensis)]MCU7927986.1 type VI secretion system baseplate subunit TssG [Candidatus Thiodiazotropha sp. (ex Dulcina madagascariensis)]